MVALSPSVELCYSRGRTRYPPLLPALLIGAALAAAPEPAAEAPRWRDLWPRVSERDTAVAAGFFLSAFATRVLIPTQNGWHGTLFFDEPLRDWLALGDPATRDFVNELSDVFQLVVAAYPVVVDAGLFAFVKEENLDLAQQLAVIDLQSLGLSTFLVSLSKAVVGRARPMTEPCPGTTDDYSCRGGIARQSLLSGHSTAAFTSAGLVCLHHEHINLYRSRWAGTFACAAGLGLATVTGGMRLLSDRHWASDVLAGAAVGLLSGYVVPKLVHFRERGAAADADAPTRGQVELSALAGFSSFGDTPEGVGGARLTVRHQVPLIADDLLLDLSVAGRAIRSGQDSTEGRLRGELRLFHGAFGLGAAVDYLAERGAETSLQAFGLYPTLSIGYLEADSMVLLTGRWGRLLGEPYQELGGRIELGLLSYLSVSAEVETRVPDHGHGTLPASTRFLGGLGGRLPW